MAENDVATVETLRSHRDMIRGVVREYHGRVVDAVGDNLLAEFASAVDAVGCAIAVQRLLAKLNRELPEERRLAFRIGLHLGDLLVEDKQIFGDGINIAARLEGLADAGGIYASNAIVEQVQGKIAARFVDLGDQKLKNIPAPVHVWRIQAAAKAANAPPVLATGRTGREKGSVLPAESRRTAPLGHLFHPGVGSRVLTGTFGVVLIAAVVIGLLALGRWRQSSIESPLGIPNRISTAAQIEGNEAATGQHEQISLGVMLFKQLGAQSGTEWMSEALRDGLNRQLSSVSGVKVYSKEFIDFLMTRQGLSEIEIANKLGITKMVMGSFVIVGGALQVETHVVDVSSGLLDTSYTTQGREEDFLALQNEVLLGIVSRLDLPITNAEKEAILAQQSTDVEALRMLLEAEHAGKSRANSSNSRGKTPLEPHSLWRDMGPLDLLLTETAHAEVSPEEQDILDLVESYRRAVESEQIEELAALYEDFSNDQRSAQQRYFRNVRDLRIAIDDIDIAVVGDEAVVSYTRTDDFVDAETGRPMHVAIRLTKTLRRGAEGWKLLEHVE